MVSFFVGYVKIVASLVALEGYAAFHRLLLFFVKKYPALQAKVNSIALDFCESEDYRLK
jgi:hypothetical protein